MKEESNSNLAAFYDTIAPAYERAAVPVYRPIAKRLLQLIDLRPGWKVLDAGTGTGLIALLGAPRVGKNGSMVGVDLSEKMLAIARAKAAQFGFSQCEFRVGDLQALEMPADQFDACLSQFALHHNDPSRVLSELHRVLRPGGSLVLHEWAEEPNTPNAVILGILPKYRGAEASGALAAARALAEQTNDFRSTWATPAAFADLAQAVGFSSVKTQAEKHNLRVPNAEAFVEYARATPLVYAEMEAMPETHRAAFLKETSDSLRPFETGNGFVWTYNVMALLARK